MDIMDFIGFVKTKVSGDFYPLRFHKNSPSNCTNVFFGYSKGTIMKTVNGEFRVRAVHPKDAEIKSKEIINNLSVNDEDYLGYRIILIEMDDIVGRYIGTDNNDRFIYQVKFRMLYE